MNSISEAYGRIEDDDREFDLRFWQAQGDVAIFDAALDLLQDAQLVREGHADEPRLQRAVEDSGRA